MTLHSLYENYYFHDSNIISVEYNAAAASLRMAVDFCCWMQENYHEDEPQCRKMLLTFSGVTEYRAEGTNHDGTFSRIHCGDIYEENKVAALTEIDNGGLRFDCYSYTDDEEDIWQEILIYAKDVSVTMGEPLND